MQSSDWIHRFKIPQQFSLKTMKALEGNDKMDITSAIRCEIISSIATLIMVHTITPTPEQYTIVSQRLVTEYPILADGYGCGYVSKLYVNKSETFTIQITWLGRLQLIDGGCSTDAVHIVMTGCALFGRMSFLVCLFH